MHTPFYDQRFSAIGMDGCAVCGGRITLAQIEPHPTLDGREIHSYTCKKCGPVKTKIVVGLYDDEPPLLAT